MKTWMTRFFLWGVLVLALVAFATHIFLRNLNLNHYKTFIEQDFKAQTGLTLNIRGPIHFSEPFRLKLTLEDVVIDVPNPPQNAPSFLEASKVSFIFGPKALLKRDFFPRKIEFDDTTVVFNHYPAMFILALHHGQTNQARKLPQFAVVVKNSKVLFHPATRKEKTLTIHQSVLILNNKNEKIRWTGLGDFQKRDFDITLNVDQEPQNKYDLLFKLIAPKNALNFNGQLDAQKKKLTGEIDAKGKDLSNVLSLANINILKTGSYSFEANVSMQNKKLFLNILRSNLLGGRILGTIQINWNSVGMMLYNLDMRGLGLNAGETFAAFKVSNKFSNGDLFFHYQMKTHGDTGRELLANQSGILSLGIKNTQYTSLGLAVYTQRFFQLLSGDASTKQVQMNCLVWLLDCETGNCHTQALVFNTPGANVVGRGDINFKDWTIDMMMIPTAKFVNLNPLAVPVTVQGPLNNPSLAPAPTKMTAELTDILFNMVTGRTFLYMWRDLLSVMEGNPYQLMTCINTLRTYNQQEESSLSHGL